MKRHIVLLKEIIKYYLELLFCFYLKLKRRHEDLITMDDLESIKSISSSAYPEKMRFYTECANVDDFVNACDCIKLEQIYYFAKDNWYIIVTKHFGYTKIWDFAADNGKCGSFMQVVSYLFANFKNDTVKIDCRATTSYPLILSLAKRGRIKILSDKCIAMNDELFHEVTIKDARKKKRTR